jgi:hypothetical protein
MFLIKFNRQGSLRPIKKIVAHDDNEPRSRFLGVSTDASISIAKGMEARRAALDTHGINKINKNKN